MPVWHRYSPIANKKASREEAFGSPEPTPHLNCPMYIMIRILSLCHRKFPTHNDIYHVYLTYKSVL